MSSIMKCICEYAFRLFAGVVALSASIALADTHYVVKDNAGAASPYTSWATAAASIQPAISDAACVNGDTVLISNGVYTLGATITCNKSITIKSATTNRSDVVVDGDGVCHCFYLGIAAAITGRLEGITVKNGVASDGGGGGGIRCYPNWTPGNSFTISDCTIVSNIALTSGGAGVYMYTNSILTNCTIQGNFTGLGGSGVFCRQGAMVTDCVIRDNITTNNVGGGINCYAVSSIGCATVRNCLIERNVANSYGGGIYADNAILENCTIVSNVSTRYGGAGICFGGESVVRGCAIVGNMGSNCAGGGVYFRGRLSVMDSCTITGNVTTCGAPLGGGGVFAYNYTNTVRNCLIVNNTASGYGGGVSVLYAGLQGNGLTVDSCTIVRNQAASRGGGYHHIDSTTLTSVVFNTICYLNTSGDTYSNWYGVQGYSFTNCCTAPTAGLVGSGNVEGNPMFVDRDVGNYRLIYRSPCVDSGVDMPSNTNDIDGTHRPLPGSSGTAKWDMGAYEYVLPARGVVFRFQ